MEKYEQQYNKLVETVAQGVINPKEFWKREISTEDKRKIMTFCAAKNWNEVFHRVIESYNLRYR